MSVSIDSSVPVLENGFQHGELLSASNDDHEGVIVDMEKPMDSKVFRTALRASLLQWRKQGKKGVWIKLPIGLANLVETTVKEGFRYHHAEPDYLMLVHWIPETTSTIPANATHRLGIGAIVMNDKREMKGPTKEWVIRKEMQMCFQRMEMLVQKTTILEVLTFYQMKDNVRIPHIRTYITGHRLWGLSLRQIYEELPAKYPTPCLKMEAPTRKRMQYGKTAVADFFKQECERTYSLFEELFSAGPTSFDRKWEELDKDCLVKVFQKVGIEPLLFATTYVCKTWHEASRDRMCWEPHFPEHLVFSKTGSMEFIVHQCSCHDTLIMLSEYFPSEAIEYFGNRCLALKSLGLYHRMSYQQSMAISNQISKWANLETLTLMGGCHMRKLLPQIGLHCNNFTELRAPQSYIGRDEASLIVTHLPKVKHLILQGSTIRGETLVMIMQGCKELVSLDVRDCTGFRTDDAEILQLASHIPAFKCEGSRDFGNYRHMLFNGVPPQEIVIDWDHFFHNF